MLMNSNSAISFYFITTTIIIILAISAFQRMNWTQGH